MAGARLRSRLASTAGRAAAMARRVRRGGVSSINPSWASCRVTACTPAACGSATTPSGVSRCISQNVSRQQTATLACVRRNAAQQTGNSVGGTERSQSFGVGRSEQTPGGDRDAAGAAVQIGAPVLCRLECRLRLGLARIDQRQQVAAIEHTGLDRVAERLGHLMAAVRPFHHLAPPLQPDQRERRLRHRLARPRQFVVERVQRQQRIALVRRREQRREEPIGIVPANQRRDRLVHEPLVASVANPCQLDAFQHGS